MVSILLCAFITAYTLSPITAPRLIQSEPVLTANPSSVVIKVGDSAKINLTLTKLPVNNLKICFDVDGFPTSGFVTLTMPSCANLQSSGQATSVLTVEATPAAAPQSFTAFVVASDGNSTVRAPISITVVPAMPAWIPWSIILVFILILIIPLTIQSKKTKHRSRK